MCGVRLCVFASSPGGNVNWLGLGFGFGAGFTCERCASIFGRAFRAIATPGPIDGYPRISWRPSAVPTVHLSHFFVAWN